MFCVCLLESLVAREEHKFNKTIQLHRIGQSVCNVLLQIHLLQKTLHSNKNVLKLSHNPSLLTQSTLQIKQALVVIAVHLCYYKKVCSMYQIKSNEHNLTALFNKHQHILLSDGLNLAWQVKSCVNRKILLWSFIHNDTTIQRKAKWHCLKEVSV